MLRNTELTWNMQTLYPKSFLQGLREVTECGKGMVVTDSRILNPGSSFGVHQLTTV